ncbi:MAG: hypothetical protein V4592_16455 [Bacteroidota bacterium]
MNHTEELIKEVIGLLIGMAIFVMGIRFSQKRQRLLKNGRRAKATVIELVQDDQPIKSSVYYPVLQFITAEKVIITKQYRVRV